MRSCGREPAIRKLAFIVLLFVIVDCFNAQVHENGCFQGQYYNLTINACVSCTNCSSLGQVQLSLCSEHEDALCDDPQDISECRFGEDFYDADISHCQPCTECKRNEEKIEDCRIDEDTQCLQRCAVEFDYLAHLGICVLNCDYCPNGVCRDQYHCLCQPESCYAESDFLCHFYNDSCEGGETPSDCRLGEEFYNADLSHCQPCTECKRNEEKIADCRIDEDTHCDQRCAVEFDYLAHLGICVLNCDYCPDNECRDQFHCRCQPEKCYAESDFLCRFRFNGSCKGGETPSDSDTSSSTSLDPWLLVVGVLVVGIVVVTVCCLIIMMRMCIPSPFSSRRRPQPDIGNEESPTPNVVTLQMKNLHVGPHKTN